MRKFLMFLLLVFSLSWSYAQTNVIKGIVTSSEDGSTLPGVSVVIEGSSIGTVTDIDGKFSLMAPGDAKTLVLSFVGMATKKVALDGKTDLAIEMTTNNIAFDEVVVTALGISRNKKALGYAVQEVSGDELTKAKDQNVINSLSGKIAGIQVTGASGAVGSSSRITIRGNSSFSNNQPLFVVDGIPISNYTSTVDQYGGVDFGNGASDIDPSNVESITVLKGANAAALYGMNAANGVILITTKGAKKSKGFEVNVNSSVTLSDAYVIPHYQDKYGQGYSGSEYIYNNSGSTLSYQDWATANSFTYVNGSGGGIFDNMDASWGPRLDIGLKFAQFDSPIVDGKRVPTDWVSHPNNVKDFFVTGVNYDNNISIQSTGEKGSSRLFLSRQDIEGTVPNTGMGKTTASISGAVLATDRLTAKGSVTYTQSKSDNLAGQGYDKNNVMQSLGSWFGRQVDMNSLKDNWDSYDENGNPYNWNSNYHNNPYWTVYKNTNRMQKDHIFGNMSLDYKLTNWMSVTGRVGTDWFHLYRKRVNSNGSVGYKTGGSFWQSQQYQNEFNADLIFNFNPKLGNDFSLSGVLGANYRDLSSNYVYITAAALTVPDLFTIGNVSGNPSTTQEDKHMRSNSVFGSASIDYKGWIYLDLTGRNDWSSTLASDNWSFFYPSVTLSWLATEALPIKSDVLSYLKLRASWAQVGNATDPYKLAMTYVSQDPFSGVTPFALPETKAPTGLVPEKIISTEVGLETSLFNDRVGANFTYYDKVTQNQIMKVETSKAKGFGSMMINAGEIENSGVELELSGKILKSKNGLNWDIALNWAKNKNRVNELYEGMKKYQIAKSWSSLTIEAIPGKTFGVIKGYDFARNANGDLMVDADGLPMATDAPVEIGNVMPDWTGGMNNSFSYKNFSASFLIDMRWGGDIFSVTDWFGAMAGTTEETAQMASRDGFSDKNIREVGVVVGQDVLKDENVVTESGEKNSTVATAQSYYESYWSIERQGIIDGSFVKLREVTLGYALPQSILNRVGFIKRADFSLVGRNLAILWTHKSNDVGIDPETAFGTSDSGMGIEQYQIPSTRTIGFKLNLTF